MKKLAILFSIIAIAIIENPVSANQQFYQPMQYNYQPTPVQYIPVQVNQVGQMAGYLTPVQAQYMNSQPVQQIDSMVLNGYIGVNALKNVIQSFKGGN